MTQPAESTVDTPQPDDARVEERAADLLPEELSAGSDDPRLQAAIILEDSDRRTEDPGGTQQQSVQTPDDPVSTELPAE